MPDSGTPSALAPFQALMPPDIFITLLNPASESMDAAARLRTPMPQ
ncbi:MAG: hypothetical protein ABFR82_01155 [Nitrospirota bacterium]